MGSEESILETMVIWGVILSLTEMIFITGANGFIGSHLTRRLVKSNKEVHILIKKDADIKRLKEIQNKIIIHQGDLTEEKTIHRILNKVKPKKIFHLGSLVNPERNINLFSDMIKINLIGTLNLLKAIKNLNIDCFINTGTCEEYGNGKAPFKESQTPKPVSPYSFSKVASTKLAQTYHVITKKPIITLRPFLTYGPNQSPYLIIPSLINKALKNENFNMTKGEQTRDIIFVDDVVDAYIKASESKEAIGKIINVGTGKETKVRDLAEKIIELTKSETQIKFGALPYREGEVMHFFADTSKVKKLLNWEAKISLTKGLKKTIDWYRKNEPPRLKSGYHA